MIEEKLNKLNSGIYGNIDTAFYKLHLAYRECNQDFWGWRL